MSYTNTNTTKSVSKKKSIVSADPNMTYMNSTKDRLNKAPTPSKNMNVFE